MAGGSRSFSDEHAKKLQTDVIGRFESIESQVRVLQGIISSIEGNWRGLGANSFITKQNEINTNMDGIKQMLMDFVESVQLTKKDKHELESEIDAAMNKVDPQSAISALLH